MTVSMSKDIKGDCYPGYLVMDSATQYTVYRFHCTFLSSDFHILWPPLCPSSVLSTILS